MRLFNYIYFWQLMRQQGQIQSIKAAKNNQKVVLVALKHIFDQIRAIQQEESHEISAIKEKYQPILRLIQQDTNRIVQGYPIQKEYIKNTQYFFEQAQKKKIEKLMRNNKKIEGYWFKVLSNFYGEQFTQVDGQIAKSIKAISTAQTQQFIDLSFEFGKNEYIEEGIYTKRCLIDKDSATKVSGNVNWIKKVDSGIFYSLFPSSNKQLQQNSLIIAQQFLVEIVSYSIQHYFGAYERFQSQYFQSDSQEFQGKINKKVRQ